jgi:hypothetical protein
LVFLLQENKDITEVVLGWTKLLWVNSSQPAVVNKITQSTHMNLNATNVFVCCSVLGQENEDITEVALDLTKLLWANFSQPAVVHFYTWLLAGYSKGNSDALNHAVVSFLWRLILPEHVNLEPALYQVSAITCHYRFA